jgi:hypothetical protein
MANKKKKLKYQEFWGTVQLGPDIAKRNKFNGKNSPTRWAVLDIDKRAYAQEPLYIGRPSYQGYEIAQAAGHGLIMEFDRTGIFWLQYFSGKIEEQTYGCGSVFRSYYGRKTMKALYTRPKVKNAIR